EPPSPCSLTTARPFRFSEPAIAPRTLCCCHSSAFPSCSIVAPSGLRSIASSRESLVNFGLDPFFPGDVLATVAGVTTFLLVISGSGWLHRPAGAGACAIASVAQDLKSKRRSFHCEVWG